MTTETRVAPTPGPWIVYDDDDGDSLWINAGADCVAYIDGADIASIGLETSRANASLISAAPDLLAACEAMLAYDYVAGSVRPYVGTDPQKLMAHAIAKATGA